MDAKAFSVKTRWW